MRVGDVSSSGRTTRRLWTGRRRVGWRSFGVRRPCSAAARLAAWSMSSATRLPSPSPVGLPESQSLRAGAVSELLAGNFSSTFGLGPRAPPRLEASGRRAGGPEDARRRAEQHGRGHLERRRRARPGATAGRQSFGRASAVCGALAGTGRRRIGRAETRGLPLPGRTCRRRLDRSKRPHGLHAIAHASPARCRDQR